MLRGSRLIVPKKLREECVALAHGGSHLGSSSMKRRLRTVAWFPGMDQAVEDHVAKCRVCLSITEKPTKVEQRSHTTPSRAWEAVSIDHFGPLPNNSHILVVRCDLSRFPAAVFVRTTTSTETISALTEIYTTYGFPCRQRSDNGPAFQSTEFREFCQRYDISHSYTAPHHPRANPAETFMRVLKKTFQSCNLSRRTMREALLSCLRSYRTTPHPVTNVPPTSLMFSHYRSELLTVPAITKKEVETVRSRDSNHRQKIAKQFNNKPKVRPSSISIGQLVILRDQLRTTKLSPRFGPDPHRVLNKEGYATFIVRNEITNRVLTRHEDDMKAVPPKPFSKELRRHQDQEHFRFGLAITKTPRQNLPSVKLSRVLSCPIQRSTPPHLKYALPLPLPPPPHP